MKKLKKIVIAFTTLALVLTMGVSSMMTAFAASGVESLFSNATINFKSTAYYGEEVNLTVPSGVAVAVTGPNGKAVTVKDGKFTADMVGYYSVSYSKGAAKYDQFKILVSLKDTYVLLVDDNGATIPTYVKTSSTDKVTLPAAKAVVYDEDGEVEKSVDVTNVTVIGPDGEKVNLVDNKFAPSVQGTYFVRYAYAYSSVSGYSEVKDFKILSQVNFDDSEAPTLSVNNPDGQINLKVGYTLPKATASDNFDANVKVTVSVVAPNGGKVYQAEVNKDYDYATAEKTTEVVFDNNGNMKFYPLQTGEYSVTYTAVDDSNNQAVPRNFKIDVVDKLAPVITVDETAIPYSWGSTVKYGKDTDNGRLELADTAITFPYPEVIDNSGNVPTIGFNIKNSKGDTIIAFDNIADSTGNKTTYTLANGAKSEQVTFEKTGFKFDFDSFKSDSRYGDYTITYTAKDAAKISATKSYTLNYSDLFEDYAAPVAAVTDFPGYIMVEDVDYTTYTVPVVSLDETASKNRTKVELSLRINGNDYPVKEGDKVEFKSGLVIIDGVENTVTYGKDVILQIKAQDHAGNQFVSDDNDYTAVVINKAAYANVNYSFTTNFNTVDAVQNEEYNLGGFVLTSSKTDINYDYVGFELIVTDPSGAIISRTESDIIFGDATGADLTKVLSVSNIKFTPGKFGTYGVAIKAFDISGNAAIITTSVEVAKNESLEYSASVNWAAELEQGQAYKLEKLNAKYQGKAIDVTIHVEGAHYSMSAKEFTALASSNYQVVYSTQPAGVKSVYGQFEFTANDSSKPGIQIMGTIPVYNKLNETVILPDAVGISLTGLKSYTDSADGISRNYKVEVKDKAGNDVKNKSVDGKLAFTPTVDGKYTIKYTVTGINSEPAYFTFTMSAGDISAPDFTLASAHALTYKLKDYFTFNVVNVDNSEINVNESRDDITYTKTLVAPDGTQYSVTGTGDDYANRKVSSTGTSGHQLTQSGTYKITYTVKDKAGNESTQKFTFTVASDSSKTKISTTVVSTILVIVGVLLLVGVGVYLWRGRPIKEEN